MERFEFTKKIKADYKHSIHFIIAYVDTQTKLKRSFSMLDGCYRSEFGRRGSTQKD